MPTVTFPKRMNIIQGAEMETLVAARVLRASPSPLTPSYARFGPSLRLNSIYRMWSRMSLTILSSGCLSFAHISSFSSRVLAARAVIGVGLDDTFVDRWRCEPRQSAIRSDEAVSHATVGGRQCSSLGVPLDIWRKTYVKVDRVPANQQGSSYHREWSIVAAKAEVRWQYK